MQEVWVGALPMIFLQPQLEDRERCAIVSPLRAALLASAHVFTGAITSVSYPKRRTSPELAIDP
jgi:hypothetical protein